MLDLDKLSKKFDEELSKWSPEDLEEWLIKNRQITMIDAKNLRIGNWISWSGQTWKSVYVESYIDKCLPSRRRVSKMKHSGCFIGVLKKNLEFKSIWFEDIEPIPLTEEWLLKFGFELNKLTMSGCQWHELIYKPHSIGASLRLTNGDHRAIDSGYGWTLGNVSPATSIIGSIQFVHQLQNLYFALTGKELKVK